MYKKSFKPSVTTFQTEELLVRQFPEETPLHLPEMGFERLVLLQWPQAPLHMEILNKIKGLVSSFHYLNFYSVQVMTNNECKFILVISRLYPSILFNQNKGVLAPKYQVHEKHYFQLQFTYFSCNTGSLYIFHLPIIKYRYHFNVQNVTF